jgi:thymidylate synthase (FAD)
VLEHAVWTLLIEGVSRSLTHELVRHRAGFGFSQLSQRYVDESDIGFVLPPEIEEDGPAFGIWTRACEASLDAYRDLLGVVAERVGDEGPATMRKKRARQAARAVLPNCAETKIVVTGNARAWRHFMEMRGSGAADVEIRRLAAAVLVLLRGEAPHVFGDMHTVAQPDGTETVETPNSKV